MKRAAILLAFLFLGCTDEASSYRVLKSAGYSDVQLTGWSPFACSKDDQFETGFRAKGPTGQPVEGTVCCGLVFKACTIRF